MRNEDDTSARDPYTETKSLNSRSENQESIEVNIVKIKCLIRKNTENTGLISDC